MTEFSTRQTVRHSPNKMFNLVADIEAYPQFVPLCEDLQIIEQRQGCEAAEGSEIVIADMTMAYKLFRETFRSRVTLSPAGKEHDSQGHKAPQILVEYLDGPFSHLENRWQFHESADGGSEVEFYIAYEFRRRAVQMMVGPVFDKVFRRFIDAFEARADQLYG